MPKALGDDDLDGEEVNGHLAETLMRAPPISLARLADELMWVWDPAGLLDSRRYIPDEYLSVSRALAHFSQSPSSTTRALQWLDSELNGRWGLELGKEVIDEEGRRILRTLQDWDC